MRPGRSAGNVTMPVARAASQNRSWAWYSVVAGMTWSVATTKAMPRRRACQTRSTVNRNGPLLPAGLGGAVGSAAHRIAPGRLALLHRDTGLEKVSGVPPELANAEVRSR